MTKRTYRVTLLAIVALAVAACTTTNTTTASTSTAGTSRPATSPTGTSRPGTASTASTTRPATTPSGTEGSGDTDTAGDGEYGIHDVNLGDSVSVPGHSIEVVSISDSRCPDDVQCSWAGAIDVDLEIDGPGGSNDAEVSLSADASIDESSVISGDLEITLLAGGADYVRLEIVEATSTASTGQPQGG